MKENTKNKLGFISLLLGTFLAQIDSTIVNVASPTIGMYMNSSIQTTSWIVSSYALTLGVLLITASKIADQFGRKKLFLFGIIIFGVSSIFCAASNTIEMLIFFRAIQGVGAAILTPVVFTMAINIFGNEKNAFVSGAIGGISGFSISLGGPIGGFLTQYFGWKWIFLINIPICILTFIIAVFYIDESYDTTASKQIDFIGITLLSGSLFLLVFSLIKATDYGITSLKIISMVIAGLLSLVAFFYTEKKVKAPMLNLSLFKEKNFRNSTIASIFLGIALSPSMFLVNYFLNDILGYTTLKTGITVSTVAIACMIVSVIAPAFYKKIGYKTFSVISMLAFITGNYLLSTLTPDSTQMEIILFLTILGIAMGCGAPALLGGSMRFLKDEQIGVASGVVNMSRQIGVLLGIAIFVSIFNYQMGVNFNLGKKEFVSNIQSSMVLDNREKSIMINSVNMLTVQSQSSLKKEVLNKINHENEDKKSEVNRLINTGVSKLKDSSAQAFRFTFIFSSLSLTLSLFFVFRIRH